MEPIDLKDQAGLSNRLAPTEPAAEPLDLVGKPCPIPVVEAKKALSQASPGQKVRLLVDNDPAAKNLARMAAGLGHAFHCETTGPGRFLVTLTAGSASPAPAPAPAGGLAVVIGRETLGHGPDPDLGRSLMKAFIYSLTGLSPPPEHLLFLNGGAFLTTQGSAALDDLKTLEGQGVAIATCGACLDFYQLSGKLQVGSVTDMFAIAAALARAGKVVTL